MVVFSDNSASDEKADGHARGYPRPMLRRAAWISLDGAWDFAIDREGRWTRPEEVVWSEAITVPFAPETLASGIGEAGFFQACWYRRDFDQPAPEGGRRLLLHFGAVDYAATVWINGRMAVRHEGGYTPFLADITDLLDPLGSRATVVVRAGYWPKTGITAPDDAALRRDVDLAKLMGFNGVRKHQKIEDPRYLFWADVLGLLVWEEMPSAYRYTKRSIERLMAEWVMAIDRDLGHPCIVAWVPFNESWGVPDLPDGPAHRHYVQTLYHLTKTLDPTRPVAGNDGWESVATDIIGIHDYDADPGRIAARYGAGQEASRLLAREQPAGRRLVLDPSGPLEHPIILTEFGGIALSDTRDGSWGYSSVESTERFADRYTALLAAVHSSPFLAGFCYTQFADTYQEANGLLYEDRTPKSH